jgi:hypothetical protein
MIVVLSVGIALGLARTDCVAVETAGGVYPPAVQVIRPEIEILEQPVIIEAQVEPSLGTDTSMRILCATSMYRGEVSLERQDLRVRFAIAGEIQQLAPKKIFVSFDVEGQLDDAAGGKGFAASGGAILEPGMPKSVMTIGGRSLFLTVHFAEQQGS